MQKTLLSTLLSPVLLLCLFVRAEPVKELDNDIIHLSCSEAQTNGTAEWVYKAHPCEKDYHPIVQTPNLQLRSTGTLRILLNNSTLGGYICRTIVGGEVLLSKWFLLEKDYYLGLPHKLNVPYNVTQELKVSVFNEGEYQLSQMSMFLNGKEETRRWRLSNSTATFEIRLLQDSELYFVTGMGHTKVKSHMVQAIVMEKFTSTYEPDMPTWIIIMAGCLGTVVIVTLVGIIIVVVLRKLKRRSHQKNGLPQPTTASNDDTGSRNSMVMNERYPAKFEL